MINDSTAANLGALHPPQVIVVGDSISNLISQINSMINTGRVNQFAVVQLRNVSSGVCSVSGHPRLVLLNGRNSLPSRTARLGSTKHIIISNLVPGRSAAVLVAYSTKTTQPGTRCHTSTNLLVAMPGMGHLNFPANVRACNDGLLYVSPCPPRLPVDRSGRPRAAALELETQRQSVTAVAEANQIGCSGENSRG